MKGFQQKSYSGWHGEFFEFEGITVEEVQRQE
jgi:hypothetical protein